MSEKWWSRVDGPKSSTEAQSTNAQVWGLGFRPRKIIQVNVQIFAYQGIDVIYRNHLTKKKDLFQKWRQSGRPASYLPSSVAYGTSV